MITNIRDRYLKYSNIKFCQELEQRIQDEIEDSLPSNWDEDYITRRILVSLGKMTFSQIKFFNSHNNVFILPFKLTGSTETNFGDIAIVLDIEFKDGDKLKGVAFLEAKKFYEQHNSYHKVDISQLQRIYDNAPSSKLLLYNNNHITKLSDTGLDSGKSSGGMLPKIPATYTCNINANTAIEHKKKDKSLHKLAIPFSYQFVYRYLNGMDLEFSEDAINAALGYFEGKYGYPKYTLMVTVKPGTGKEKNEKLSFNPEINKDVFTEISFELDK